MAAIWQNPGVNGVFYSREVSETRDRQLFNPQLYLLVYGAGGRFSSR